MTRCPHCFHLLGEHRYTWACRSGQCTSAPDAVASGYRGTAVTAPGPFFAADRPPQAKRGAWAPPASVVCRECGVPATEMCPDCHYPLPPGWRDAQATCVAMAGARATGKSLYIGVLVKQLEMLFDRVGATVEPATEGTRDVYHREYERPLFEQRGIMKSTVRATETEDAYQRDPLIYSLGSWRGQRRYLVLRDVAGEDLESSSAATQHLAFFAHADAVFFMFDPFRVTEIRDQLADLVPAQANQGGDPKTVLANLMRIIGPATPRLAVILSKFDAIQALREVEGTDWSQVMANPGAAFSRDPSLDPSGYQEVDGQLLHLEVRSMLQRLHAGPIVTAIENPASGARLAHRFFAVSALGESPNGERLHSRGIAPFRCLDPLRWVLADFGVA